MQQRKKHDNREEREEGIIEKVRGGGRVILGGMVVLYRKMEKGASREEWSEGCN